MIPKKKKKKKNNQKPILKNHVYLWTGQGTLLVPDFHRPNGAKILRFQNFPERYVYIVSGKLPKIKVI